MRQRVFSLSLLIVLSSTLLLASTLHTATIVSVRQELRSQTQEMFHNTMLDSAGVVTTSVVYQFSIRSGNNLYVSEYVAPADQPNLPNKWSRQVLIRVEGNWLYIEGGNGAELRTHIVRRSLISS
jgi:hypothetical protein